MEACMLSLPIPLMSFLLKSMLPSLVVLSFQIFILFLSLGTCNRDRARLRVARDFSFFVFFVVFVKLIIFWGIGGIVEKATYYVHNQPNEFSPPLSAFDGHSLYLQHTATKTSLFMFSCHSKVFALELCMFSLPPSPPFLFSPPPFFSSFFPLPPLSFFLCSPVPSLFL